ncbi:MAG: ABC transporter permease [Proteobacteria bacterium]|nr:ABC transporter permease [Pseudomonadota bacterium]
MAEAPLQAAIARLPIGRRHPAFRDAGFLVGCAIVAGLAMVAVLADVIAPHDPYSQSLIRRLRPPVWYSGGSWTYPLGTDAFGRDYLSRLIHGTRISLAVGAAAASIAGLIGASLGVVAGYAGGIVDRVASYVISTRLALPSLLIALAILQVGGSGLGIVILVLGLTHWDRFAVVMRTVTRQVESQDYITRARTMGCSDWRIITRDVVPNVFSHFVVVFTFEMAQCILATAILSFLGLGIQAPEPSWGLMMAEGRTWLTTAPWLTTAAGLALMLLVLAINLVGDGLRARLTPERRH